MNRPIPFSIATLPTPNLISRSPLQDGVLLVLLAVALACFALSPTARAVTPAPDGGYPNGNTAKGDNALLNLTTGTDNTAIGNNALQNNTTGNKNTANGSQALFSNMSGRGNTAVGFRALESNTTGSRNTATGIYALEENTIGTHNTANGYNALYYSTGSNNIGVGANAGVYLTTGSYNIDVGNAGIPSDAGKIRIGTQGVQTGTCIAGIYGVAVAGSPVVVNSFGKLGVASSSTRFKEAIKPMDKASETILALQPVTFRYTHELDPDGVPQFGLIAEQVEKVNPDLIVRGEDGKVMTVRYEAVNAMLLNEFLKEHCKVEQQDARLAKQEAIICQQQKQIEALTDTVRKVSERVELSAPVPQIASN